MTSSERNDSDFTRSSQRIKLEGVLFHFLQILIHENSHAHDTLLNFLRRLTQKKELCSMPISFSDEVDVVK